MKTKLKRLKHTLTKLLQTVLLLQLNKKLVEAKNELQLALASGGSAVQDIIDKTNRLEASKNDLQKQVDGVNLRVKNEQDTIASIEQSATKVVADASRLREEIKVLESSAEACEEDKVTKDNQIRTIREEIAHQEELIVKLQRDKKDAGGGRQKIEEDMQAMEDRCVHLGKVKVKLEMSLDECEDVLERERKGKGDVEKIKRKLEGDLKLTQETVSDLERSKTELQAVLQRKEKEFSSIGAKIDDEHTLGGKYGKQIKELQSRIDELDDELSIERQCRAKAEKSRTTLSRALADLNARLEDTGLNTSTQIELNKKKLDQLNELKQELDESNIAFEGTLAALRSKHNSTIAELGEQIDNLNKNKSKSENDKAGMERDLQDTRHALEEVMRDRANIEKNCKMTQATIAESNAKFDELARALNDADSHKKKLLVEQQDLVRQIEETENAISQLGKNKISLSTQLADTKTLADAEARDRATLLSKFKGLGTDCENLKMKIDEEAEKKNNILRLFSKAQSDIQLWKSKYETEALSKIDELEEEFDNTRKNHARAMDSMQASLECEQRAKAEALRIKKKLEGDINDLEISVDKANKANNEAQKLIKRHQGQYRDAEIACSEEAKARAELQGKANMSERRANALHGEMEEARSLLDSADRGKRQTEKELEESRKAVSEMAAINSKASAEKRRIEGEVHTIHAEIDQTLISAKNSEEKAKKAMLDAARLADELRAEQDHCNGQAKSKKALESQLVELDTKIADAEENAIRGGRAAMAKMESRIRELELELGSVQAHTSETQKGFMRTERKSKELAFQVDEDKKNQQKMTELVSALQSKIKTYKKQIEEAEEIAALNLAKFRKSQQDLEESEERANLAGSQLSTNVTYF